MAKKEADMSEEKRSASSRAEFFRLAGIGPEFAMVVAELIEKPEIFYSLTSKRRREIENQMNAIICSFD